MILSVRSDTRQGRPVPPLSWRGSDLPCFSPDWTWMINDAVGACQ